MSDEIVRYDKTRASLALVLGAKTAEADALDLALPGVEGTLGTMATKVQNALDMAKSRRDLEALPHASALADVKVRWRPVVDGLDDLFRRLKVMASDVLKRKRDEEERLRREAQARLDAAREAERKAAEDAKRLPVSEPTQAVAHVSALGELRSARAALDALPPSGSPIGVKTAGGTLFGRKVWKWETLDVSKVPDAYVQRLVDPTKVDLAVDNGVREIPGLRIFEDVEMTSRRVKGRR